MTTETVDATKAEEFAGHLIDVLNSGCLALQCSIGHQVGLFDTMADLPPSTSEEIAEAAGLTERYVREWLGALTTGRIVTYDPSDRTYVLPAEHAASLTRAAGPENLARILQFVPLLATVEAQVVVAFRNGGGVPYSEYETFHTLMADDSGAVFDASLVDTTLPLVAGLPGRLETGIDVADIGCGSGHAVNLMARAYPGSRFTGYDFSADAIEVARAEAAAWGLSNARFEVQDVARLEVEDGLDLVTAFDAIHDQAQPTAVLARVARALQPGGTFLMVDIKASSNLHENHDLPWAPFLYTASTMHCMAVSLELDGEGLGTVWGRQKARVMLDDAGFEKVEIHEIEADPFNLYYVATAGS